MGSGRPQWAASESFNEVGHPALKKWSYDLHIISVFLTMHNHSPPMQIMVTYRILKYLYYPFQPRKPHRYKATCILLSSFPTSSHRHQDCNKKALHQMIASIDSKQLSRLTSFILKGILEPEMVKIMDQPQHYLLQVKN